jgi:hypothetical protein
MAEDLKRKNRRTPKTKRIYDREYARLHRAEKRGDTHLLSDVPGIVSGKYLKRRGHI